MAWRDRTSVREDLLHGLSAIDMGFTLELVLDSLESIEGRLRAMPGGELIADGQSWMGLQSKVFKVWKVIQLEHERNATMATEIAGRKAESRGLREWVSQPEVQGQIAAALGGVMDAGQFITHMLTAFQSEKVAACTPQSKYRALHECAAMALLPTLGQVVLIPYFNNRCPLCGNAGKAKGAEKFACDRCKSQYAPRLEVKCTPQWQGYKALMERNPEVREVTAMLVHVNDKFSFVDGQVQHDFDPFDIKRTFRSVADLRGGYATITYTDGRPWKRHLVSAEKIRKAQECAETQKVWTKWYHEMALKTIYRDCYARRAVPIDPLVRQRIDRAVANEDDEGRQERVPICFGEPEKLPLPAPAAQGVSEEPDESESESKEERDAAIDVESVPAKEKESDKATAAKQQGDFEFGPSLMDEWKLLVDSMGGPGDAKAARETLAEDENLSADEKATVSGWIDAKEAQWGEKKRRQSGNPPGRE